MSTHATARRFLAFDFGAESGRGIAGTLADGRLSLEEVHRFPTQGIVLLGTRQWDVTRIYGEMLETLRRCAKRFGPRLDGIGVDTWGVDFGLVARDGTILGNPVHYRDHRHDGAMEAALEVVPAEEVYRATGIQFMPINTIYQVYAMARAGSPVLDAAEDLLLMGDLFHYMLTGRRTCEYTNASTSQLLDVYHRTWHDGLIERLGLPRRIFGKPVSPGTRIGAILPEVAAATGLSPETPVIAPATHDTGCAVAAVPEVEGGHWAYLSSGTWSLLGAELDAPLVDERSRALDFTNEGGVDGTIRFLKNIIGLWLVQECRRSFERDGEAPDYAGLMSEAEAAAPFATIIDVDDRRLLAPDDMPAAIGDLARESGQPVPESRGAMIRCALESLALRYRRTLREMDGALGRRTGRLHVIGGGARNTLLCRMTASACGVPVLAGPVEATAIGNILVQAMGAGALASLAEARRVVADSFEVTRYEPEDTAAWDAAERRFGRGKAG